MTIHVPTWLLVVIGLGALILMLALAHPVLSFISTWWYDRRHNP